MIDSETMLGTGMLKLSVSREALVDRLALVARGVSTRTAVLVLGGIQLRATDGQLHLAATDMELSLRSSLDADIEADGEVVVPGRLLLDIVRALPDSDVVIEHKSDESMLLVTAGSAGYRRHTHPAGGFPPPPHPHPIQMAPGAPAAPPETSPR